MRRSGSKGRRASERRFRASAEHRVAAHGLGDLHVETPRKPLHGACGEEAICHRPGRERRPCYVRSSIGCHRGEVVTVGPQREGARLHREHRIHVQQERSLIRAIRGGTERGCLPMRHGEERTLGGIEVGALRQMQIAAHGAEDNEGERDRFTKVLIKQLLELPAHRGDLS